MPYQFEYNGKTYQVDTTEELKTVLSALPDKNTPESQLSQYNQQQNAPMSMATSEPSASEVAASISGKSRIPNIDEVVAALRGFTQGGTIDAMPSILSKTAGYLGDERSKEDWQKVYSETESTYPEAYMPGYLAGSYLSSKGISGLTNFGRALLGLKDISKAGLISRLLINAGENATMQGISAANRGEDVTTEALTGAAQSLGMDTALGLLGKTGQLLKTKFSDKALPAYRSGVDYNPVEAAEALKREMGSGADLQLTPEQIMRQPSMIQSGVSPARIIEQEDIMRNYARELEADVGIPSGKASTKYTQIEHDALAPRLDRYAVANKLGQDISSSYQDMKDKYAKAYEEIDSQLSNTGDDVFQPKIINKSIKDIRDKIGASSGLTTQRVEQFMDSIKSKGFTEEKIGKKPYSYIADTGLVGKEVPKKGETSLYNLFALRQDVSDLAFETTSDQSKKYLESIKKAIDSELNNYALSKKAKNPELATKILDLNRGFSQDISNYEKSTIASILNKSKNNIDLLNDPTSITKSINKAISGGDTNTLESIEKLVPPDTLEAVKQEATQYVLRGKNPIEFDFKGMQSRMQEMSPKAKKFLFGDNVVKYENMATIGKYLDSTWKYSASKYGPPDNLGLKNPATYSNYIRYLASKFNNTPTITKMLTRDYKKIITPSAASLASKKFVDELFRLESLDTGQDNTINQTLGE